MNHETISFGQLLAVTDDITRSAETLAETERKRVDPVAQAVAADATRHRKSVAFSDFPGVFGEPAWDMLLDLFIHDNRLVSISNVCRAARAPQTTALRYLRKLEEANLVVRQPCVKDARVSYVQLTATAVALMKAVFEPRR